MFAEIPKSISQTYDVSYVSQVDGDSQGLIFSLGVKSFISILKCLIFMFCFNSSKIAYSVKVFWSRFPSMALTMSNPDCFFSKHLLAKQIMVKCHQKSLNEVNSADHYTRVVASWLLPRSLGIESRSDVVSFHMIKFHLIHKQKQTL